LQLKSRTSFQQNQRLANIQTERPSKTLVPQAILSGNPYLQPLQNFAPQKPPKNEVSSRIRGDPLNTALAQIRANTRHAVRAGLRQASRAGCGVAPARKAR